MVQSTPSRLFVIAAVWGSATVGAVWLAGGPGRAANAPAIVIVEEYRLSALETGKLAAVFVAPGQRVAGGQVVARLDTAVLEREIAVAEARLRAWEAGNGASEAPRHLRPPAAEQIEVLRVLRARLENAKIVAAADGQVASVTARQGDIVRAGDPFIIVNGTGTRQVLAYLPERAGTIPREGGRARLKRRTARREEFESRVIRVAGSVTMLPARLWLAPQVPAWGREVVMELPPGAPLDAGEALDVAFIEKDRS